MKIIKAEFIPMKEGIPQTSTFKNFRFKEVKEILKIVTTKGGRPNAKRKKQPRDILEETIKKRLWDYADKRGLALYHFEVLKK